MVEMQEEATRQQQFSVREQNQELMAFRENQVRTVRNGSHVHEIPDNAIRISALQEAYG